VAFMYISNYAITQLPITILSHGPYSVNKRRLAAKIKAQRITTLCLQA